MGFIPRTTARRPRPVGRPPTAIPAELQRILDETFTTNSAYTDDITEMDPDDLQKLRRMGTIHADRRGLSFRWRILDEDNGRRSLVMWLQVKQKYNRAPRQAAA
jgi:hypothetical protein